MPDTSRAGKYGKRLAMRTGERRRCHPLEEPMAVTAKATGKGG
ncbi:hypothetical protein B4135_4070 [Caldibacillus debilis]|uniref:Uncharacterized protein n=1 Tax=Caldibacillus debilis TaxID=301148 RepID=A0A150L8L2_9BACI|nr:hypothetical protein B4135_4070 [Caldibacillus debilis]